MVDVNATLQVEQPNASLLPLKRADVVQAQSLDTSNSITVTAALAQPGSPWVGAWSPTRGEGIVRILTVLASGTPNIGGTFTFEFSENGNQATISEARTISNFETVRDFDLLNAGAWYRVKFEPSAPLGSNTVILTTTFRRQDDGNFVRLATQQIEEINAAMGNTFAYLKAFDEVTGKSVNIRPEFSGADPENQIATPLGAAAVWTGEWRNVEQHGSLIFLYAIAPNTEAPATVQLEYSDDKSTILSTSTLTLETVVQGALTYAVYLTIQNGNYSGRYVRPKITNGAVAQTATPITLFSRNRFPFTGSFGALNGAITLFSRALLTRTVLAGERPDGTFANIEATQQGDLRVGFEAPRLDNLCSDTAIGVGATITTPFVQVKDFASVTVTPSVDQLIQGYLEWSTDGATVNHNNTTPFVGGGAFSVPIQAAYVRVKVTNLAASIANFVNEVYGTYQAPGTFLFPVAGIIDNSFPASLVKSATTAQQPDGDWVNARASGLAKDIANADVKTTTPLGASGVYQSGWIDTDGWDGIEITIATNVASASDGIVIEFTDDPTVGTVRSIARRTFAADDVAVGFTTIRLAPRLDGCRIRYTNGGTAQGSFFLEVDLRADVTELPQGQFSAQVGPTNLALMTRGGILAKTAAGAWSDIERGTAGGLDVGIVQHEVETPLKSLVSLAVNQSNVTAVAALIISPTANRRSLSIRALIGNTQKVYIGPSGAVTASNGYELAAGAALDLDLDENQAIYMISNSGTQRVCWMEVLK